jgi:excisionase family DNA binding protein
VAGSNSPVSHTLKDAVAALEHLDRALSDAREQALALHLAVAEQRITSDPQVAYTVQDAAGLLGLGERTVWEMIRAGEIESVKIGKSRRISRAAIVAFIESKRGEESAA